MRSLYSSTVCPVGSLSLSVEWQILKSAKYRTWGWRNMILSSTLKKCYIQSICFRCVFLMRNKQRIKCLFVKIPFYIRLFSFENSSLFLLSLSLSPPPFHCLIFFLKFHTKSSCIWNFLLFLQWPFLQSFFRLYSFFSILLIFCLSTSKKFFTWVILKDHYPRILIRKKLAKRKQKKTKTRKKFFDVWLSWTGCWCLNALECFFHILLWSFFQSTFTLFNFEELPIPITHPKGDNQ